MEAFFFIDACSTWAGTTDMIMMMVLMMMVMMMKIDGDDCGDDDG